MHLKRKENLVVNKTKQQHLSLYKQKAEVKQDLKKESGEQGGAGGGAYA